MISGSLSLLQVQALVISALAATLSFVLGRVLGTPAENTPTTTRDARDVSKRQLRLMRKQHQPHRHRRIPRPGGPSKDKRPAGFWESVQTGILPICSATDSHIGSCSFSPLVRPPQRLAVSSLARSCAPSLSSAGAFTLTLVRVLLILAVQPFILVADNVATPVAACLGDLVTLTLLAFVASGLIGAVTSVGPLMICIALLGGLAIAIILTRRNVHVAPLLGSGWGVQIGAMVISSITGLVLDHYVERFEGFGVLAIVTGGLPGAVGSVYVSRLSTSLHAHSELGSPVSPSALASARPRLVELSLFLICIPVLVIFVTFLDIAGWVSFPLAFVLLFSVFFCVAVLLSLYLSRVITFWLWRRGHDPDMYALPIQCSIVDLISQILLVGCYIMANALGADVLTPIKH